MNKFGVIVRDVYKKNVKSGAFLLIIALPFLVLAGVGIISSLAGNFSNDSSTIGIVSTNQELGKQFAKMELDDYKFEVISSKTEAEKELKEKNIDGFLLLDASQEKIKGELFVESSLGSMTELLINQLLNSLQQSLTAEKLNLSPEQFASLSESATFEKIKVNFDQEGNMKEGTDNTAVQSSISFVMTVILFMFISFYISIISQEIASEKGSRIMEVILSSTTAYTHFYGKLIGILLVVFTQVIVYGIAIALGISQLKDIRLVKDILDSLSTTNIFGSFFYFTLLFLIIGIFSYSVLAAVCGSLVSKSEDTAKAIQPVMFLGMIGYILGLSLGMADPQNVILKVTSFIPFISSYTMPIRLANEVATTTEAVLSLAILTIFSIILTLLTARLYKTNVLVYNDGGVFKALKQSIMISRSERKK